MRLDASELYDRAQRIPEDDRAVLVLRLLNSMIPEESRSDDDAYTFENSASAQELLDAGLLLREEERGLLAGQLAKGVDFGTNACLYNGGWNDKVKRRMEEADEGRVAFISLAQFAAIMEREILEGQAAVRFHPDCIDDFNTCIASCVDQAAIVDDLEAIAASEMGQLIAAREAVFPTTTRLANEYRDFIANSVSLVMEDPEPWAAFAHGTRRTGGQIAIIFRSRPDMVDVFALAMA